MHRATIQAAALALACAGCSPATTFTARGAACPSASEDCEVVVITRRPERDYQVVGVLDIEAFSVRAIPRDEAAFLALVRPSVCAAGGDAVIPGVNGDGRYIQATVVKWVEEGSAEPACVPDAGTPEAGAEEGGSTEGEAPSESTPPAPDETPSEPASPEVPAAPSEAPSDGPAPEGAASPEASASPSGACAGGAPC